MYTKLLFKVITLLPILFSWTDALAQEKTEEVIVTPGTPSDRQVVLNQVGYQVTLLRQEEFTSDWCDPTEICIVENTLDPVYTYLPAPGFGIDAAFLFTYMTEYSGAYVGYVVNGNFTGILCSPPSTSIQTVYCFEGDWTDGVTPWLTITRDEGDYTVDIIVVYEIWTGVYPDGTIASYTYIPMVGN